MSMEKEALEFHQFPKPGKIEVHPSKPCNSEKALSLAYSPGVAVPCMAIAKDPSKVYDYTSKGNLVAVISDGTAVLGLGNIGPLAGKPVMEGKGILFKQFAGIDVFDIEVASKSPQEFINAVKALEPTFGGINLEDIKAPECFEIEETLKKEMKIPVFHDDQHGTAIISGAAMINACHVTKRKLENIKLVVNGAGASAIACTNIFLSLGVKKENVIMCDSQGVIYKGRKEGMNKYKEKFANDTEMRSLSEALKGADVFVGLSAAGAVTQEMVKTMAASPIIFAMANPDPEILPSQVKEARPDAIVATGRSDFPNQVNNVLGFPSIFRGALDTRATQINEAMKLAAVHALAALAREDVPEKVSAAYGGQTFKFGPDYLIPKPFDPRVLLRVAPAVAKAAMDSGVAQIQITDFDHYRDRLEAIQGPSKVFIRSAIHRIHAIAQQNNDELPLIVFPEGTSQRVLKAISVLLEEKVIRPVLLGYPERVKEAIEESDLKNLNEVPIYHPARHPKFEEYVEELYSLRQRKGVNRFEAERLMRDPDYFAAMMVRKGEAAGLVTGATHTYADSVKPVLQTIGVSKGGVPAGLNFILHDEKLILLADTTININPTAEQLAQIAIQAARVATYFNITPRIAMLSYSNFGGGMGETPSKMREATEIVKNLRPDLIVDGDMQADTAVNSDICSKIFPFSSITDGANILIFPNLEASNISYKLLQQLGKGEVIGPFLMGIRNSANILQQTTTVESIVNSVVLTALEAQYIKEYRKTKNASR